ncbi:hypothetical protein Hypma_013978 [Hypsizygus marmoreus]|uniref:Uncharacterized protein n=1 Tax=Hypsizygus marmoreus TaxID=39966 RepID=A0A369KG54_HYPMA|nr:hypothetical protein Hypma_013978 [Hypsizygus marmoreus]
MFRERTVARDYFMSGSYVLFYLERNQTQAPAGERQHAHPGRQCFVSTLPLGYVPSGPVREPLLYTSQVSFCGQLAGSCDKLQHSHPVKKPL